MSQGTTETHVETREPLHYLSKNEAVAMELELLREYHFGPQQLTEIWGHACACAIAKAYPLRHLVKRQPTILVICGPGDNGCVGLACARHLRIFDYTPTVYYPKRSQQSFQQDLTVQCEKMDIPFLSYLPTEVQLINDAYNLVVDGIMGVQTGFQDARDPFAGILLTLKTISIPIVSLDIPSGWDVEAANTDGISPAVLISLLAPKKCAAGFQGKHFLAGRFLPYDLQKKYELNMPKYPGTECIIELTSI
ncbi:yjeF N-terminal domain-containing protein 3-like [Denticeps clupeoides]|uniref:ApoA-I-binding protein 2 n=1 Tax=Denticeps clupeoides TaxID=299321 RepID=A0AAY4EKQ1_9TELE|nr:yjeF N-terminal domain-containing protein 3-like [Denticeps clupeoides]